ncbi:LOW QUALITY PROTEIN: hypothetical protein HID58_020848, partial [Brassica napus]
IITDIHWSEVKEKKRKERGEREEREREKTRLRRRPASGCASERVPAPVALPLVDPIYSVCFDPVSLPIYFRIWVRVCSGKSSADGELQSAANPPNRGRSLVGGRERWLLQVGDVLCGGDVPRVFARTVADVISLRRLIYPIKITHEVWRSWIRPVTVLYVPVMASETRPLRRRCSRWWRRCGFGP